MKCYKQLLLLLLLFPFMGLSAQRASFVRVRGTQFFLGESNRPYYFVGTHLWYAPLLASKTREGDRDRLLRELDSLQAIGVNHLRVPAAVEGRNYAALLSGKGMEKFVEKWLVGLDFLLAEMSKRGMHAVVYFGNAPVPQEEGHNELPRYLDVGACKEFDAFVESVVMRRNTVTDTLYRDDPTILAWQVACTPRPGSLRHHRSFAEWMCHAVGHIKRLDPNHLVSTGSEGFRGCDDDEGFYRELHEQSRADYLSVQLNPVAWRWVSRDRLFDGLGNVFGKATGYLEAHLNLAQRLDMPLVVENFDYLRDNGIPAATASTMSRDAFFGFMFIQLTDSRNRAGAMAGCYFRGWAGAARPAERAWKPGQPLLPDVPSELQGCFSVYNTDSSTVRLIEGASRKLRGDE